MSPRTTSVAAAWWPPSPTPMATSSGCFKTDECRPPLPPVASSRNRAPAHPRQRCPGGQCLGGRCTVPGAAVLRLGGRGAADGHVDEGISNVLLEVGLIKPGDADEDRKCGSA